MRSGNFGGTIIKRCSSLIAAVAATTVVAVVHRVAGVGRAAA
jgi:hypothetical protein